MVLQGFTANCLVVCLLFCIVLFMPITLHSCHSFCLNKMPSRDKWPETDKNNASLNRCSSINVMGHSSGETNNLPFLLTFLPLPFFPFIPSFSTYLLPSLPSCLPYLTPYFLTSFWSTYEILPSTLHHLLPSFLPFLTSSFLPDSVFPYLLNLNFLTFFLFSLLTLLPPSLPYLIIIPSWFYLFVSFHPYLLTCFLP